MQLLQKNKLILHTSAILSCITGIIVIIGWLFNIQSFKSIFPHLETMKFNTAINFILIGISLFLLTYEFKRIAYFLTAILIIISSLTLSQDILQIELGIDEFFIEDHEAITPFPGRMATISAIGFLFMGLGILFVKSSKKKVLHISQACFHFVTLFSFIAIIGYLYKIPSLYKLSFLSSIALNTSILFFILSIVFTFFNKSIGIIGLLSSSRIGSVMVRATFPWIIVLIIILGFLRVEAHRYNFVSVEFGIALFAISFILVALLIFGISAYKVNKIDEARSEAEEALKKLNANLELLVEKRLQEANEISLELKSANEKLISSNKNLEQFAYVASHDLQEPLRMISGFLQLLAKKYGSALDEDAKKYIKFAVDGADRMKNLINDILDYAKINTVNTTLTKVDLNAVIQEIKYNFSTLINSTKTTLKVDQLPVIDASLIEMQQLFTNLITNAIKYTKDKTPIIEIKSVEEETQWIFSIRDNGIGIDTRYFDRIFVLFQRLHNKSEYSGTGIGLAICKKIVEGHGGKIWVESKKDEGSTFYFTVLKNIHEYQNSTNSIS